MNIPEVASVEAFRALAISVLRQWLARIDEIPLWVPQLRGEMQAIPGAPFHLIPELFLQVGGETHFVFPEEEWTVGPGEICLVPRGMPHHERAAPRDGPFRNLLIAPSRKLHLHLAGERPDCPGRPGIMIGDLIDTGSKSCATLLDEVARLRLNGHDTGERGARGALAAVFALLLALLEGNEAPPTQEPFRVMLARQQVHLQLHDPDLTVATLAARLQCNPDYLSRLFRHSMGRSLQTYLLEQRLILAMELLAATGLNISEVSQSAGFRDPAYFARAFRRWAGVSPREARRQHELHGFLPARPV